MTVQPGTDLRCTWQEPSRNADVSCHAVGTAWWFDHAGRRVVRCRKHFREAAADAARSLGWEVHNVTEGEAP